MAKKIISLLVIALMIVWTIRFYAINKTFLPHNEFPTEKYDMNEVVWFDDNMLYNVNYSPGYGISVNSARIINFDDFLNEYDKNRDDFLNPPDAFIEIETTIENLDSDNTQEGIYFYSLPLIGVDWYTFYNSEATAYANSFFEDDVAAAYGVLVRKNTSATVKILYNLREDFFTSERWNSIADERINMMITITPIRKVIDVQLSSNV